MCKRWALFASNPGSQRTSDVRRHMSMWAGPPCQLGYWRVARGGERDPLLCGYQTRIIKIKARTCRCTTIATLYQLVSDIKSSWAPNKLARSTKTMHSGDTRYGQCAMALPTDCVCCNFLNLNMLAEVLIIRSMGSSIIWN